MAQLLLRLPPLSQYLYLLLSVVVLTPLTLALDGTDWSAQFRGWNATDWALLVLTGSAVCVVANLCIQHSTWQLGAPTVSMFYVSARKPG